jgi:long-subunit acyl-CoA synthetase (AMP-forming)
MKALNIIGFNHPAWFIAFYGCIFARILPVGVYATNGPKAC